MCQRMWNGSVRPTNSSTVVGPNTKAPVAASSRSLRPRMNASVSVDWSLQEAKGVLLVGIRVLGRVQSVRLAGRRRRILAPDPGLATRAVVPVGVADVVDDQPHRPPFVLVTDLDLGMVDALCPPLLGRGVLDEVVELPMSCDELVG